MRSSYGQGEFFDSAQKMREGVLHTHNLGSTGMPDRWRLPWGTASLP